MFWTCNGFVLSKEEVCARVVYNMIYRNTLDMQDVTPDTCTALQKTVKMLSLHLDQLLILRKHLVSGLSHPTL